jgi:hypothetical protein
MLMPERFGGSPFGLTEEDWRILATSRANVLLVGPEPVTSQVVDALLPVSTPPIARWRAHDHDLPSRPCGTLLLADAERLTPDDQQRLDEWLTDSPPQVLATATTPLFPLVEQGRFLARLYYRLNVVYLELEASGFQTDVTL